MTRTPPTKVLGKMQPVIRRCHICGNSHNNTRYRVREMMQGTRDTFEYFQCAACGCLQIAEAPVNLPDYYSSEYYSYKSTERLSSAGLRQWADTRRVRHHIGGGSFIGRWLDRMARPLDYLPYARESHISMHSQILDVGCGQGRLLMRMNLGGFTHCTGLDPFIEQSHEYPNGVRIIKAPITGYAATTDERYDLIVFHHSFEHIPDQSETLAAAAHLLTADGSILMRVPLCDSHAWEHYRENWVQLDAPRHLYLHTRRSIELLANRAGMEIEKIIYDSSSFQFTGSELYRRDIPLNAPKEVKSIFSRTDLKDYAHRAHELNREGRGDQAAFYLRRRR